MRAVCGEEHLRANCDRSQAFHSTIYLFGQKTLPAHREKGVFNKLECNNVGWEMQTRRRAFGVYHAKLETFAGRGCNHGIADGDSKIEGPRRVALPKQFCRMYIPNLEGILEHDEQIIAVWGQAQLVYGFSDLHRQIGFTGGKISDLKPSGGKAERNFMLARTIHGILDGEGNIGENLQGYGGFCVEFPLCHFRGES